MASGINFDAVLDVLNKVERFETNEKEVRKALTRIENLQSSIAHEVQYVYSILDGAVEPKQRKVRATKAAGEAGEVDAEAPYGRKKDGSPKAKPGRGQAAGE